MSIQSRRELLETLVLRYKHASRAEKGHILDEFAATAGYARKYAIRLLNHPTLSRSRSGTEGARSIKRSRKRTYGPEVARVLTKLWRASNHLCSKRLVPFLGELVSVLERHGELDGLAMDPSVRAKVLSLSPATADRLLSSARAARQRRGLSTTKPGTLLRQQIPVRTFADWKDSEKVPGFAEIDLVAHCGESTHGEYANSLVLTDVATGWTETAPLLNRSQKVVFEALHRVRKRLPFALLGLDSDNGSEFISRDLVRYCQEEQITFTRCRPYKKNDQCHVEQKNWSIVRQVIGYERYEGAPAVALLAAVYEPLRLHVNFFQPSLKLREKQRGGPRGGRVTKRYDTAKTPYQRLLDYGVLSEEQKQQLHELYLSLNPLELQRRIRAAQERLWSDPTAKGTVRNTAEATKAA